MFSSYFLELKTLRKYRLVYLKIVKFNLIQVRIWRSLMKMPLLFSFYYFINLYFIFSFFLLEQSDSKKFNLFYKIFDLCLNFFSAPRYLSNKVKLKSILFDILIIYIINFIFLVIVIKNIVTSQIRIEGIESEKSFPSKVERWERKWSYWAF